MWSAFFKILSLGAKYGSRFTSWCWNNRGTIWNWLNSGISVYTIVEWIRHILGL